MNLSVLFFMLTKMKNIFDSHLGNCKTFLDFRFFIFLFFLYKNKSREINKEKIFIFQKILLVHNVSATPFRFTPQYSQSTRIKSSSSSFDFNRFSDGPSVLIFRFFG